MPGSLPINERIEIPASDLTWSWSRSSGPGGQHVNTTDTKARVHFALSSCDVLTAPVKERLRAAQPSWVTQEGDLVLSSDQHRSRHRNIEAVEQRLADAIRAALRPPKRRQKTRPSKASKERRLQKKKQRSDVKKTRRAPLPKD